MKKLLLLLSFLFVAFAASAGDLNPFAYNLKSTFDESTMTLSVSFNVNARAKSVKVIIVDSQKNEYLLHDFGEQNVANSYGYQTSLNNIVPQGERFTWRVDVEGYPINEPTVIESSIQTNKLFYPTSVDIDNNPENANFGTVFCIEGREATGDYLSTKNQEDGPGLYLFNAEGTPRKLPFLGENLRYSYNGGKRQKEARGANISLGDANGFPSYRVRVSDDGRVFITGQRAADNATGTPLHVLWEAHKERFSATTEEEWRNSEYSNWTNVISSANENTYSFSNITVGSGTGNIFYGGPNMGFDLRGSGDGLKLLMLSGDYDFNNVRCDEYSLGDEIIWEKAPSKKVFTGYAVTSAAAQVQYDKNGNVWMCQLRYEEDEFNTLVKFSNTGTGTVLYEEPKQTYRRAGAIRFNDDFTQFAVVSAGDPQQGGTGKGGTITIYPVNDSGDPDFTSGQDINVADKIGLSIMDIAWDYAGNMYVAADGTSDSDYGNKGRCIGIFAMPRENNVASTPAASQYSFSTEYTVNWWNLFLHGQDVKDETKDKDKEGTVTDYSGLNHRLWRLLQVGYNEYRYKKGAKYPNKLADKQNRTVSGKVELNVKDFFVDNTYSVVDFFANDSKFSWLGKYISEVTGIDLNTQEKCGQYADDFINRKNNFTEKGKPEYWRPLFTKAVLGLNDKMCSSEYMPIGWHWEQTDEQYFDTIWVGTWPLHIHEPTWYQSNGYQYATCPSQWYYFNTVGNHYEKLGHEFMSDDTHILAWRNGGTNGDIVHHVDKPMDLYATYVEKKLDENDDPTPDLATNPYDATNDDVIQLMMNRNFLAKNDSKLYPAHEGLTVARKLQAGMYNTICLPLSNDQSAEKNLDLKKLDTEHPLYSNGNGTGATVLAFTGITPAQNSAGEGITMLNFTQVSQMQAGKPYLVKLKDGASDFTDDMVFKYSGPLNNAISTHNELDSVSAEANGVTFTFVPTINPTEVPAGSLILVADNRLALTTKDGQMAGMRGYFTFSGLSAIDEEAIAEQAAEGRVLLNIKRPTATSVAVAPDSEKQNAPEVRKLMYENQIYIIRDNAVYTITGLRIN